MEKTFIKKTEGMNRPRVDTLEELDWDKCHYISKDHLKGELVKHLDRWTDREELPKIFMAHMKNVTGHSRLIYAAAFSGAPRKLDINVVVNHLIEFAHNGDMCFMEECEYQAEITLLYYESLLDCKDAIKHMFHFDEVDDFTFLDLYPIAGSSPIVTFREKNNG